MSASALLDEVRRRGLRISRRGDRLRLEPAKAVPAELIERVKPLKPELLALVPDSGPAATWRGDLETWSLRRHSRWAARASVYEVLDGLPHDEAGARAYRELAGESDGDAWIIAGEGGAMRLAVVSEPPWPAQVFEAAAIVSMIDRELVTGRDARAAFAAEELERVLAELRRAGVEAYLTS